MPKWIFLKEKASYTVEAAWIISICMLIIFGTIRYGFDLYKSSIELIEQDTAEETSTEKASAEIFRKLEFTKNVILPSE